MSLRKILTLRERFSVLLHADGVSPSALEIDSSRLLHTLAGILGLVLLGGLGTLLFFRELEQNRRLSESFLELQNRYTLLELKTSQPPATLVQPIALSREPSHAEPELAAAPVATPPTDGAAPITAPTLMAVAAVRPRLGDFTAECSEGTCTVRLGMVPSSPGTVEGRLTVVLETELPRIGVSAPGSPVRRRYLIYPGNEARTELDATAVASLSGKTFKFSRGLQTQVSFEVEKTHLPIAANVYLFDGSGALAQHERKAIKTGE